MRSVVDRNVLMRRLHVQPNHQTSHGLQLGTTSLNELQRKASYLISVVSQRFHFNRSLKSNIIESVSTSSVGIARAGQSGGLNPGQGARFSAAVKTGPGSHPASYTTGCGSVPEVKRLGRVVHPPQSSAEVKESVQLYLQSLLGFHCLLQGELFTVLLHQQTMTITRNLLFETQTVLITITTGRNEYSHRN